MANLLDIIRYQFSCAKDYNAKIRQVKKDMKALSKIQKLCKKYNLQLSRTNDFKLVISGIIKDYSIK